MLVTISNWKRTGPVEPALDGAKALQEAGHDVLVATGLTPDGESDAAEHAARARGLTWIDVGASLQKHSSPLRDLRDVAALSHALAKFDIDVVLSTLKNDHRLASRAARRRPGVRHGAIWFADGYSPPEASLRRAFRHATVLAVFCDRAAAPLSACGVRRVVTTPIPMDLPALRGAARGLVGKGRAALGVPPEEFVLGIVARMQRHRRFELLWDAVDLLKNEGHAFRVVVLGRGTYQAEVGFEPVRSRGLDRHVVFAGYKRGQDYAATIADFDAQLMLVPGSDPTCRALREGMALGVPSIVTKRGMLPDLVAHGETGWVVDESTEGLTAAIRACLQDRTACRVAGQAATRRANESHSSATFAEVLTSALTQMDG